MNAADHLLDLYHWPTPVGAGIAIMLEECALDYRVIPLDITKGDQFSEPFSTLSPNGKLPLLVDPGAFGGQGIAVFESGAILLYLARKSGKFLPADEAGRSLAEQWLFWSVSTFTPIVGQNHHFRHYAPERIDYALTRYDSETRRLYACLEKRLAKVPFLAGGDLSVADFALIGWVKLHARHGIDLAQFPATAAWLASLKARPAVEKGLAVGGEAQERRFGR